MGTLYLAALVMLSVGAFIQNKSVAPEMRPADKAVSEAWRWAGKAAFAVWLLLLGWGALRLHWSQPVSGALFSVGFNAFIAMRGPRASWPFLSMIFCGAGLLAGAIVMLD